MKRLPGYSYGGNSLHARLTPRMDDRPLFEVMFSCAIRAEKEGRDSAAEFILEKAIVAEERGETL